jgi:hypothetical protein
VKMVMAAVEWGGGGEREQGVAHMPMQPMRPLHSACCSRNCTAAAASPSYAARGLSLFRALPDGSDGVMLRAARAYPMMCVHILVCVCVCVCKYPSIHFTS